MKKFSYTQEFNRVADVVRLGDADDVRVCYSVFVGTPSDDDDGFLGTGFFSADDFTTWSDAAKAKVLVQTILETVDEHQKNLRHEIYRCVGDSVDTMLKYCDDEHFGAMLVTELEYNLNNILAKYHVR